MNEEQGMACQVLSEFGLTIETIRREILRVLAEEPEDEEQEDEAKEEAKEGEPKKTTIPHPNQTKSKTNSLQFLKNLATISPKVQKTEK